MLITVLDEQLLQLRRVLPRLQDAVLRPRGLAVGGLARPIARLARTQRRLGATLLQCWAWMRRLRLVFAQHLPVPLDRLPQRDVLSFHVVQLETEKALLA